MEDFVVDLAMDTGVCETTQSANADTSPNGIAKGIECPAEEDNQQHMTTQLLDGTDGLEFSQIAEDTDRLSRAPWQWLTIYTPQFDATNPPPALGGNCRRQKLQKKGNIF